VGDSFCNFVHLYYAINIVPLKEAIEEVEKQLLRKALKMHKTTRKVGKALGIDQSTVVKKMKKYGI
jgi:TyrR family helix-turn-helix protein